MEYKKALRSSQSLGAFSFHCLKLLFFVLEASSKSSNIGREHISYDDGISDNIYFDDIGCEFERDLEGKLRNRITEKRHRDNSDW
ncbi:hypothetical protein I6Y99_001736 [Vibrio parahaemolyticus]|uniref:hypothetical protein n=1 Tax=Vibrio parahaemolyticus TaxID=670 RepID=UPI00111FA7F3|nr:hypothetical protein [Vibrio parahaemolyticus]EGQ7685476.1 hypothetical protein [Vibrio parahaemolyticus]EGQ7807773.1 hypothetical protein [Vibrio parahaemolyticus]EGQ8184500.1 hypothetical protein [Vibrio parahaemolyticus]EGQ8543233.1 hypothetical protein [Vibrio parahaemolyticus]EHH2568004.1 hypothetical protein [Vibrio parahaemolyticus]